MYTLILTVHLFFQIKYEVNCQYSSDACLYHGVVYKSGDKWDDGCTYNCECIDGMTGSYRCTER